MKYRALIGVGLALSILLNASILWRLNHSAQSAGTSKQVPRYVEVTDQATGSRADQLSPAVEDSGSKYWSALAVEARLESFDKKLSQIDEKVTELIDLKGDKRRVNHEGSFTAAILANTTSFKENIKSSIRLPDQDDWFWESGNDGEEKSLAFGSTDGFNVDSVVCRSEWCRVEIEDYQFAESDKEAELELHLKIDESLGRDTTLRMGPREGNRRVLYIQ